MEFDVKSLKFDETRYFEDYVDKASEIAEDLANFAGGILYPASDDTIEKLKEIMELPIYRGYLEQDNGRLYVDAYQYKGGVYNEKELSEIVSKECGDIEFQIVFTRVVETYSDSYSEQFTGYEDEDSVEFFNLGIGDLFYYKYGPDGKGAEYFEPSNDCEVER